MDSVQTWVWGFDLHHPAVSWPTWNAMLGFIEDIKPAGFGFGGDQFNNECISHHTKNKPIYRPRGAYIKDQETFETKILTPLEAVLPKESKKIWIVGNHDDWEFQFIEENPELEGLVDRPKALHLEERGWRIVPLGGSHKLGKLNVCHGEWLTGIGNQAGMYPSRKAVDWLSGNVLAGHTHAPQSFTRVAPVQHTQKWMGWISPILGATNPAYMRGRPSAWLNGFTIVEVHKNGLFNLYPVIVSGGKFIYGGKEYSDK